MEIRAGYFYFFAAAMAFADSANAGQNKKFRPTR